MTRWLLASLLLCVAVLPRSSTDAAESRQQVAGLATDEPKCYDSAKGLYSVNAVWTPLATRQSVTYAVQSKQCAKRGIILCGDQCVAPLSICSDAEPFNSVTVTATWQGGSTDAARYTFPRPEPRCLKASAGQ
jgi:hypothetical protein